MTRVTGARTLSRMRFRSRSGWTPGGKVADGRPLAHARPTQSRRSTAWSTGGRRDWRRQVAAGIVLAGLAIGAFLLASRPSGPWLTDPKAILDATTSRLAAARSVHVTMDLDGTVSLGLFSPIGAAGTQPLALTGTHADGDIDIAGRQASLAFEVPALLGLTGRIVELPDGTYLSSSLSGEGWVALGERPTFDLPGGEPVAQIANLRTLLADLAGSGTKLDDADCGAATCYQVRVWLTSQQVRTLVPLRSSGAASSQPSGRVSHTAEIDQANATIVARVDRDSLRLAGALIHVDLGSGSTLDLDLRFTAWDGPVAIAAPSVDAVTPSATPGPAPS